MARFRRSFRGSSRPARRTNWIAGASAGYANLGANSETSIILVDVADGSREEAGYVGSTLTRVRGNILVDPVLAAASSGSELVSAWFVLYVSPGPLTFLSGSTAEAGGKYSSDRILWVGCQGYSKNTGVVAGTDAEGHLVYALRHDSITIDVKAQRKLGDDNKLYLQVINSSGSNIGFDYQYVVRALLKE